MFGLPCSHNICPKAMGDISGHRLFAPMVYSSRFASGEELSESVIFALELCFCNRD